MTEAEWLACNDPEVLLRVGWTSPVRKRRLFSVACCKRVINVMPEETKRAIDAVEAVADGSKLESELELARLMIGYPRAERRGHAANAARAACWSTRLDRTVETALCAVNASVKSPSKADLLRAAERAAQCALIHDIFGNPFRPVVFKLSWRASTVVALASQMYDSRDFSAMPILGDALQDAGCDNADVLSHCRESGPHVRGCWVVDLVLRKE